MSALSTVVIPNYNHARYLRECLEAVLAQAQPELRIIFIDDASSDHSIDVARTLLDGRVGVTIIEHRENRGVVAGLNEGLALVETPFVAFAAADDRLLPHFLEVTQQVLRAVPHAALAAAETDIIDAAGRVKGHRPAFPPAFRTRFVPSSEVCNLLTRIDNFLVGNVTLYRTEMLRDIGGFDATLGPLCDGMSMRLLAAQHGFCFVRQTLGQWRRDGESFSTTATKVADAMENTISRAGRFIAAHEAGKHLPAGYGELLARRLRFGGTRVILEQVGYRQANGAAGGLHGCSDAARPACPPTLLNLISRLPLRRLRTLAANLLLYLVYRPFAPSALLRLARSRLGRALSFQRRFAS